MHRTTVVSLVTLVVRPAPVEVGKETTTSGKLGEAGDPGDDADANVACGNRSANGVQLSARELTG